jgi:hypothetical protein
MVYACQSADMVQSVANLTSLLDEQNRTSTEHIFIHLSH